MKLPSRQSLILVIAGLSGLPTAIQAVCVDTAQELQTALTNAATNGQDDTISIERGIYSGSFVYDPPASEDFDLTISGGWFGFPPCSSQASSPYDTELRTFNSAILRMIIRGGGDILIENLVFANTFANFTSDHVVDIAAYDDAQPLSITMDRVGFLDNSGGFEGILKINDVLGSAGIEELVIRNSIFSGNSTQNTGILLRPGPASRLYFTNNTVTSNVLAGDAAVIRGGGLAVGDGTAPAADVLVANNILWGNDEYDLQVYDGNIILRNNNIEDQFNAADEELLNQNADPEFETNSLRPVFYSPMVDAGRKPRSITIIPVPFVDAWSLGILDFHGDRRVQGNQGPVFSKVDIGAVEVFPEIIFLDSYE